MQRILTVITGAVGAGASEAATIIPNIDDLGEACKLITQIVILGATLFALFKKKKTKRT
jgi:hypothetical protein